MLKILLNNIQALLCTGNGIEMDKLVIIVIIISGTCNGNMTDFKYSKLCFTRFYVLLFKQFLFWIAKTPGMVTYPS